MLFMFDLQKLPVHAGVTAADFPKAFIAHQFIGAAFLALTWAACYQIQPTKVMFNSTNCGASLLPAAELAVDVHRTSTLDAGSYSVFTSLIAWPMTTRRHPQRRG